MVEITARTVGARFLLVPRPALTARILGTIGRALSLFPVDLHAFAFLSNHWHGLISAPDALAVTRFVQHVHSNVAFAVNELHGWDGKVFGRSSQIVVATDAEVERLRYLLAQGAKEGLVATPYEWPGAHCARALAGQEELFGVWLNRSRAARLRAGGGSGGGREASESELSTRYPIELVPIPSWQGLGGEVREGRVRAMVEEIVFEARAVRSRPLGLDAILRQDPASQPLKSKRAPAPAIHTNDRETWRRFKLEKQRFTNRHRTAGLELRAGRPTEVPAMCFPPTAPFYVEDGAIWAGVGKK
jgi:hypothetical protein